MSWAKAHIEKLRSTRAPVQFRPFGRSMEPKIMSGALVTVAPLEKGEDPTTGDVVLCTVHGSDYLHLVKEVRDGRFLIGNNRGGLNGWAKRDKVYGRLVAVEP